ncbi:MAG TPA: hypothetical protein PK186_12320 [candidate division Zixibacteria bacterium]|nr:hypothetical protein [candidate division Zixibacteria bacterium]MDD4918333.1 hypothetical protein [candidate division Zixibacteria bacterium]MDM7974039.1 hypothetical protein [candidate division Zixibacteria bacterium]HOD67447.1 hypothetical protein [candidate division Zixibacteria bacterium]HPM38332.1 hypothetical protein [candidate division Zixibacteria bacterium]
MATTPSSSAQPAEAAQPQTGEKPKISLPDLNWKTATCVVCGKPFDYHGRKPKTCRDGNCRYRFEYKIEPDKWAGRQKTLFDVE